MYDRPKPTGEVLHSSKSHLSLVQYAGCIEKERSISCLEN
ncbi:hypothetical protein HMPREF9404_5759 [Eggerthella sp. HGA1]|nr:hypothetical protein HMPREF9404_5759 [Eggerthella sp. HGA1]